MFPDKTKKYHKVTSLDIPIGQPLRSSIYTGDGKLLLKKGQNIVSERQQLRLLKIGFVDPNEPSGDSLEINQSKRRLRKYLEDKLKENSLSKTKLREIQSDIWTSYKGSELITSHNFDHHDQNLVELKDSFLDMLLYAFNLLDSNDYVKFRFEIMSLALAIQMRCNSNHDGLLGAIQVDPTLGYGLITSLKRAVICEMVGQHAGLNVIERISLICGALTCDMSYVDTQNKLAKQTEPLTDEQRAIIYNHPINSERILLDAEIDDPTWLNIVRHHHERYDGSGYPDSLRKDEIWLPTMITAIADTYSAMLTATTYRNKTTSNEVMKFLYSERNKLFDSKIINIFINSVGLYPSGSLVMLKSQEIGVVTENTESLQSPIVQALIKADGTLYLNQIERDTDCPDYKIISSLPLNQYNILHQKLEKIWGGYK